MKENKIYIVTDTHFGHEKMNEWSLRPVDFNDQLWRGLDELPENCILIHLGDVTIGADHKVATKMAGYKFKKWLIRGNHDHHSISWYVNNGWDSVSDEMVIDMFGHKILLSHMPLPKRDGITKNVHGHLHGGKSHGYPDFYDKDYHFEACPEVVGYRPVQLGKM